METTVDDAVWVTKALRVRPDAIPIPMEACLYSRASLLGPSFPELFWRKILLSKTGKKTERPGPVGNRVVVMAGLGQEFAPYC